TRRQDAAANIGEADGPKGAGQEARSQTAVGRAQHALHNIAGEVAEWFKAAVLTRRQDAAANIGEADGPKGAGQEARSQTAVGRAQHALHNIAGEVAVWDEVAVLTRRQDAAANIGEADGPKGVGQEARSQTAVGRAQHALHNIAGEVAEWFK